MTQPTKQVKVIYGDGTTERFIASGFREAMDHANQQARKHNTIVRGFSLVG